MSVVIRYGPGFLAYTEGKWTGTNLAVQQALNAALRRDPVPYFHPDPDRYALEQAKERLPSLDVIKIDGADGDPAPSRWDRLRALLFG